MPNGQQARLDWLAENGLFDAPPEPGRPGPAVAVRRFTACASNGSPIGDRHGHRPESVTIRTYHATMDIAKDIKNAPTANCNRRRRHPPAPRPYFRFATKARTGDVIRSLKPALVVQP
jgi:hypothetical protein